MTSASQVVAFMRCERYWYNKSVLKLPEPFSPAAQKGTRVHSITEYWIKSGLLSQPSGTTDEDMEIAQAAIAAMPPRGPELLVEHEFRLATYEGGPTWLGYIDLLDPRPKPIFVGDHKTRSDARYFAKPIDLLADVQMVSYARHAQEKFDVDEVEVAHLYVLTKGKFKTTRVSAILNRKQVAEVWTRTMDVVRRMVAWRKAAPKTADDLEPRTESCGMYGGCAYKPQCGFGPDPKKTFSIRKAPTMSDTPAAPPSNGTSSTPKLSLSEKLAQKKAAAAAAAGGTAAPATPPPASAKAAPPAGAPAVGVVPPDAPENLPAGLPPEDAKTEKPVEEKKTTKKKGSAARDAILAAAGGEPESGVLPGVAIDPPGTDMKKAAEHAAPEQTAASAPITTHELPSGGVLTVNKPRPRFVIYVDSFPVKGAEGVHMMFEDWFAPLGQQVAVAHGIADYRLIDFGKWKGPVANIIRENVNTLPPVIVMSSYSPGVNEALDVLVPYATKVVKGLRG